MEPRSPEPSASALGHIPLPVSDLGYATERWLRLIVPVVCAAEDVRTQEAWARRAGVSLGALRAWCRAAGIGPKSSLSFARLLRVIVSRESAPLSPYEVLDIVDTRTMQRLLRAGGIGHGWPSLDEYLRAQTFIGDPAVLHTIADQAPVLFARPAAAHARAR